MPESMENLLSVLLERAQKSPEDEAFTFHNEAPCSYGALGLGIRNTAGYLSERGMTRAARVLVVIPNSREFFFAFYGIQLAGGIAVPVFPGSGKERVLKLAHLCGADYILFSKNASAKNTNLRCENFVSDRPCLPLYVEEMISSRHSFPERASEDTAFIQFTSGSVAEPKGVCLTHGALMVNIKQMIRGMAITEHDRFVSWLPVYHDMGLILMTMVPFYLGLPLTLLPTGLNYIRSWLETVQQKRATFTAAPDFAYRFCNAYTREPGRHDLSSLRAALNAAEPVRRSTVEKFEKNFGLKNIMLPAYGLAEATVGVSCARPGAPLKTDAHGFSAVGKPFAGITVRIRKSLSLSDGHMAGVGEICIKSPALTVGYLDNPEATAALFTDDGYIATGDLGYVDESGDLFIVGREKNVIIQAGFNIAACEVEELIDQLPFVRRSAAVGIDRGGNEGEQLFIAAEVRLSGADDADEELTIQIVQVFHRQFGFRPGRVCLVKPGVIPMTYNGKIRYRELAAMLSNGPSA